MFDSTTRETGNINITLGHLLLEATGKRFGKEKAQFNYFNRFYIYNFYNIWYQGYNKT